MAALISRRHPAAAALASDPAAALINRPAAALINRPAAAAAAISAALR